MMSSFTERQLKLIERALVIAACALVEEKRTTWIEIDPLIQDVRDLIQIEQQAKRERRKSLAAERRASKL